MRSPQVDNVDYENRKRYTELMVLESSAGFYIGTLYASPDGFVEPGSRDSEYFSTRELAQQALADRDWTQRDLP